MTTKLKLFNVKATKTADYSTFVIARDYDEAKDIADGLEESHWENDAGHELESNWNVWEAELEERNMKRIKINDHQLAKLLRDNNAIDNYEHHGSTVKWHNSIGRLVCIAFYDNAKCVRQVFIPDYIKYVEDSNNEST